MKILKKKMLFVLLAIVATMVSAEAQNVKVSGVVRDVKSGELLPFVNVGLMRTADTVFVRGAATDLSGEFVIKDVTPGNYLLQASYVGYEVYHQVVNVDKEMNDINISLKMNGTTLETVEISAEKPLYAMDGEKNMYNTKEDVSVQTGTASDALQNAPGVEVDAEGNITLRGVSSVEIWINDRPSHMNEEALKQYIKQLPANAIERIEVITNPSARYSTSGGVINIVTNQTIARNELLCVGMRATTSPEVSPWVSYVWANDKIDFNIYVNGRYGTHESDVEGTNTLLDSLGNKIRYQSYKMENESPNVGGYAGLNFNWKIDSMTNLSAWMGTYPGWSRNTSYSDYTFIKYQSTPIDLSYGDTAKGHSFWGGGYAGAWFEHRFDTTGRKLSLTFNGNLWGYKGRSTNIRRYSMFPAMDFDRRPEGSYFSPSMTLGVNYTLPLKNDFEIETGGELGYSCNTHDESMDEKAVSGTWSNVGLRSYHAEGTAWTPSVYVTAQKRWGGFTAKLGLRGESTLMHGTVSHFGDGNPTKKDTAYFGLVPSIHLSYQTKTFTSYSLSYTRRFSDPTDLLDITRFRIYDDYSFRTGNPNLQRSYTHNVEAAWNKYIMDFGNIGVNAYFRANTDEQGTMNDIASDPDPYFGTDTVNCTYPVNIGSSHTEGIEANVTYRPSAFFNVRLNASLFNYGYDYDGKVENQMSWNARVNVWAKLWGWLEIFATGSYTSPRLGLYSMSVEDKSVDLGVSSDFFDRQLSVFLNVNDVFGWRAWGTEISAPNYQTTGSSHFNSSFVSVGLTWRIGKMELERKAKQGATDSTPQM